MSEIIHETTVWDDYVNQPNHTYLLDNSGKIIAYAIYGSDEIIVSKSRSIKLDKRYRKFIKSNHTGLMALMSNETPEPGVRKFKVKSNDKEYIVVLKDSFYSCNCTGYNFRGKCKHVDAVAKKQQISA